MVTVALGYKASSEQFGPRELIDLAIEAERHGFDSVAVSDHFQPWRYTGGHAPFSLAWAAIVGERTSTIRIGTSVLTPTLRYNPAVVAQAFATLGSLFPDRIWLGVGTGEALNEIPAGFQGPGEQQWPPFRERFDRLREAVELIRALWSGERTSFDGSYYSTHGAVIYDRPEHPIPLYVAASGPKLAAFAGAVGDGLITTSGKDRRLYADDLMPALREGARRSSRSMHDIDRMIEIKLSYESTRARALANLAFWAPLSLPAEQKRDVTDPREIERAADALSLEQVARRWIVGADPDDVVSQIAAYIDLGFTHLIFHAPGSDQRRFMALFERDILPRLRAL